MVDPAHIGRVFAPYSFTVERGKVREFLLAIGEPERANSLGDHAAVPPTFPFTFRFWAGGEADQVLEQIGVQIWNVLHAEQEFEYFAPICVGDTITAQARVDNIYTKGGRTGQLNFVDMVTDYKNQRGELVVRDRTSFIVREQGGAS